MQVPPAMLDTTSPATLKRCSVRQQQQRSSMSLLISPLLIRRRRVHRQHETDGWIGVRTYIPATGAVDIVGGIAAVPLPWHSRRTRSEPGVLGARVVQIEVTAAALLRAHHCQCARRAPQGPVAALVRSVSLLGAMVLHCLCVRSLYVRSLCVRCLHLRGLCVRCLDLRCLDLGHLCVRCLYMRCFCMRSLHVRCLCM